MRIDFLYEKGTAELNEDCYFIEDDIFGVCDGSTSLQRVLYNNDQTGGFLASNIAKDVFSRNNASLLSLAQKANTAIRDAMEQHGVDLADKGALWNTSAAVVRVNQNSFEWAQIGDSLVLAVYDDNSHEVLVPTFNHDLETLRIWQAHARCVQDNILCALHEQILKVRRCMNVTYGAMSGEEEAMSFLNHDSRSLDGIAHILLFTDGLFIPKHDPGEREDFDLFVKLYLEGGLAGVRDHIREIEARDTNCSMYPRFKTHDDIAAIALDFSQPPSS